MGSVDDSCACGNRLFPTRYEESVYAQRVHAALRSARNCVSKAGLFHDPVTGRLLWNMFFTFPSKRSSFSSNHRRSSKILREQSSWVGQKWIQNVYLASDEHICSDFHRQAFARCCWCGPGPVRMIDVFQWALVSQQHPHAIGHGCDSASGGNRACYSHHNHRHRCCCSYYYYSRAGRAYRAEGRAHSHTHTHTHTRSCSPRARPRVRARAQFFSFFALSSRHGIRARPRAGRRAMCPRSLRRGPCRTPP